MTIARATYQYLEDLVPLFDGYRIFYEQPSDLVAARQFLHTRLQQNDSVIYMAYIDDEAVGFTQLYPLFSSVAMAPMYLLNDLYVHADHRSKGIGEALINSAKQLCMEEQCKGLAIQTAFDNKAQLLYQCLGFVQDTDLTFFWTNK